jgi:uncharacterized protein YeeX (DUF496 family)
MKVANEHIRLWVDLTGCKTPKDAAVELARLREWEKAARQRGWNSPLDLRGRTAADDVELGQWRDAAKANGITSPNELVQSANINFGQFVDRKVTRDWQEATGCKSPSDAAASFDSWKEATGCANAFQAQKKLADLESKLLSYASEIDALRKTSQHQSVLLNDSIAQSVIGISADAKELAKVRAELQSKYREVQTEKERADENAREMVKRGVLLDKIAEALGCDFNHDSLPEHVADLKHAYDKINDSLVGPDDLANETKEIDAIIWTHIKSTGVASAASSIAGRSVHLSVSWAKTMQARDILLASPGESIVDAAKRAMDRCANLEQQITAYDNRTDELRKILHAKEGANIFDVAKRAIIPLTKPEKVEAGQRWAVVSSVGYVYGSSTGDHPVDLSNIGIVPEKRIIESESWIYLGT